MKSQKFRQLLGTFATGCTVVTMESETPHGLTANAFSSVSVDPPLILICVDHGTNSYELLSSGDVDGFCVNILSRSQQDLGEYFANMTDLEEDPFETRTVDEYDTHAPVFEGDLAFLDCDLYESQRAGDHTIYLGEVQQGEILNPEAAPLAFYGGEWGSIVLDK
ncbi:flavin reductase family protein [Saliphagus sp. GCM10025308]